MTTAAFAVWQYCCVKGSKVSWAKYQAMMGLGEKKTADITRAERKEAIEKALKIDQMLRQKKPRKKTK
jgi:hypothetical protein